MIIVSQHLAGYRSKLIDLATAQRAHRKLASLSRFDDVRVIESPRVKTARLDRYFLFVRPRPDRLAQILHRAQVQRIEKAEKEGPSYVWARDPDAPFWHLLTCSGEVYEIDTEARGCTCPDYTDTCAHHLLRCKHLCARDLRLGIRYAPGSWSSRAAIQLMKAARAPGGTAAQKAAA